MVFLFSQLLILVFFLIVFLIIGVELCFEMNCIFALNYHSLERFLLNRAICPWEIWINPTPQKNPGPEPLLVVASEAFTVSSITTGSF